ncbi:MAG: AAA-like domain-containing protein, partial [Cyanobacteriota bacterium]|nr:AAA-like domain-containing protein [Cyanobacteriota bacterium]
MRKILIVTANPLNTKPLRLDEEVREIEAAWERSRQRDRFEIIVKGAVRPDDLRRAMLQERPQIVHFAGHGGGEHGLVLENDAGQAHLVSGDTLARLFKALQKIFEIECVLLNACHSEMQAEAIFQYVDCTIGTNQKIGDLAARKFAVGFYDTLLAGASLENAFEIGCSAIDLENIPESLTPILKLRSRESKSDAIATPISSSDERLPNPSLILERPDGQVPLNSAFYIERFPIEVDCYEEILKPGSLIRIKAPRQMGKTSLLSRVLHRASQEKYQTVCLNFQLLSADSLSNLDRFLQGFCAGISFKLNLENQLDRYWTSFLGGLDNCTNYFQRYLLANLNRPLVLGLDEVDQIFQHPTLAADFFGLLRVWHEEGKNAEIWQKLKLVIVHSKEVYIPLNINQSPFNVGLPIELKEFDRDRVTDLTQRHGLSWTEKQIEQLMEMVGGHPYLVRVALYQIARNRQ